MVVINMNHVNIVMFILVCRTGNMGALLLWAVVWFPIAMSIRLSLQLSKFSTGHEAQTTHDISVDGALIRVSSTTAPTGELAVGMSMGEP